MNVLATNVFATKDQELLIHNGLSSHFSHDLHSTESAVGVTLGVKALGVM